MRDRKLGKKFKFNTKENPTFADVFIRPVLTEKTTSQLEKQSRYRFEIQEWGNKEIVKAAAANLFSVNVLSVNILKKKNENKMVKGKAGVKRGGKFAIVKIKQDEAINLAEVL